jgi:hypothetical protein
MKDQPEDDTTPVVKAIRTLSQLSCDVPKDMSDEYDSAYDMVKAHRGETLTLQQEDFKQLVEDEWGWKHHWFENVSAYTSASST